MQSSLFDPIQEAPEAWPLKAPVAIGSVFSSSTVSCSSQRAPAAHGQRTPERAEACRQMARTVMQGTVTSPTLRDSFLAEAESIEQSLSQAQEYELEYMSIEEAIRYRDEAWRELVRARAEGRDDWESLQMLAARQRDIAAARRRSRR